MDPDSGRVPQNGGASAAEGGAGKPSRRRKGKRGGKNRNASASPHASSAPAAENAARLEAKQDQPARKRKRRRSRSDRAANPDIAAAPSNASVRAEPHQRQQNSSQPGSASKSKGRDRRKKNRGGRGLQGRPLAQGQGQGKQGHGQGSAKDALARDALNGVSQPALLRATSSHAAERGNGAAIAGQSGFDAAMPLRDDLYAALDLGTNNCRLLIAQPTRPGHFRVVDAFSRIVRLGEGLAATGRLSTDAMDRAVEALRICASKLASRPIRKMRLIATEACRAAANGEEFLARVTAETGLDLEIIDRETEARLAVSGCSSLVGREARSIVLFDIGGGSSEIAVIRIGDNRSSRLANHITHWTSLPVGVVTLSERHGGRDVTPDVFEAMVVEVEGMLAKFDCPPIGSARRSADHDFHLIGTSGTVTTLAGVHLDLPRYDRRRVDGLWLSDAEVSAMQAKLLSWDFAGRAANPCIGPDRADLVLAGCAILEAIRRRWPSQRMRVADRGLREGLLTDMMADDGVWRRGRSRRSANGGSEEGLRRR
ncbi:Ppx/GppA family phosphatase [Aliirhizobium terrae]|uniref:Ppx/GppA phosphatase family protein n=1 Tax=Terrirhizobium terrae TaxID=2926709 RepID=UPI0025761EE7|nr:Ppx/GppA phosphatase family protein [Rhizobium sp. CC-CFT758]WJH39074.1 Ppx/GppA family phosphatase [Rhizobium sp. CC-CFT758]